MAASAASKGGCKTNRSGDFTEDVVEAMRLHAVDEVTEHLEGTVLEGVDSTDDEKQDGNDERTGRGVIVPPPSAEISSRFGLLERAAE